jgi:hypothetical protein
LLLGDSTQFDAQKWHTTGARIHLLVGKNINIIAQWSFNRESKWDLVKNIE